MTAPRPVRTALVAAAGTTVAGGVLRAAPPGGAGTWARTNHRGEPVDLLEGPAVALGLALAAVALSGRTSTRRAGVAGVLGVAVAGAVGGLDDLRGDASAKGFRGHLGALRRGEVTTGVVKIAGVGAAGMLAAVAARPRGSSRPGLLLDGALVAGTANLLNLFDLRPGRALKVAALLSPLAGGGPAAAVLGAGSAARCRGTSPNARCSATPGPTRSGTMLGVGLLQRPRVLRRAALLGVLALTAASERVSFSRVIDSTPALHALDRLGRRPPA